MDSSKETLLKSFYSHNLHVEDKCDFSSHSEEYAGICEDVFSCLLHTECQDIIKVIQKAEIAFEITHRDVPQFSSLDDCIWKVPLLVRDCGIENLTYTQLGFMLRTKPRKEGADMKYGENHSKTAAKMGLCSIINSRIYPSHLGMEFCKLNKEEQRNLLPKLVLHIPYILNLFSSKAKFEDVLGSISFLSESTQKRRLSNIWYLITKVNEKMPYELQIIRY